ncbi:MAG: acyltransferase [Pseudonocardiales bacterium]|nr:acyltransferase [Pseudonocardiales bacterium]
MCPGTHCQTEGDVGMALQQLGWMDNSFLLGEAPRTPGHFCPVLIYDPSTAPAGAVTFDDLVETVRARLSTDRTFRRKIVTVPLGLDTAYWIEDPAFDLKNHVHRVRLPAPGDWPQFRDTVAQIHSRPLDMTRPLWEMTVIEGLDAVESVPAGSFAVMFKIHHAAVDGVSGVQMLTSLHDWSADAVSPQLQDSWRPDSDPSAVSLLGRAAVHSVTHPLNSTRTIARHATLLKGVPRAVLRRPSRPSLPERLPRTRFNGKVSQAKVFDAYRFPLADIKTIKNKIPGATVNDAALAIVAGAMRTFLGALGELPDTTLTAAVPVSTRSAEDLGAGGNQIAMLRAPLHTDIADPLARLAAIHASTVAAKEVQQGTSAAIMQDISQAMPGVLIGLGMKAMGALPFNGPVMAHTGVTNVPGSREPMYLAGARLEWFTGCTPLWDGMTFMHTVGSYREDFSVQITACRDDMPDTAAYMDAVRSSVKELLAG